MSVMRLRKAASLPAVLEASTLYFIPGATNELFELHVSDKTGATTRRLPTTADINTAIAAALAGLSGVKVVANIAERDALAPTTVTQVMVLDATADPSVTGGTATYVFNPVDSSWTKISESESMDLVLQWDNVQGRPTSSVASIDQAVTDSHTHDNKALLDTIEVVGGEVKVNGDFIRSYLEEEAW